VPVLHFGTENLKMMIVIFVSKVEMIQGRM
jgi:hypothetical protein